MSRAKRIVSSGGDAYRYLRLDMPTVLSAKQVESLQTLIAKYKWVRIHSVTATLVSECNEELLVKMSLLLRRVTSGNVSFLVYGTSAPQVQIVNFPEAQSFNLRPGGRRWLCEQRDKAFPNAANVWVASKDMFSTTAFRGLPGYCFDLALSVAPRPGVSPFLRDSDEATALELMGGFDDPDVKADSDSDTMIESLSQSGGSRKRGFPEVSGAASDGDSSSAMKRVKLMGSRASTTAELRGLFNDVQLGDAVHSGFVSMSKGRKMQAYFRSKQSDRSFLFSVKVSFVLDFK